MAVPGGQDHLNGILDYEFTQLLSEGSHGAFYLARRPPRLPVDADLVAVKVLNVSADGDGLEQMTRELRLFASIRSPYLVTLFDAGQDGSTLYYALEYLPLGSLEHPARTLQRGEIVRAVADAARAAHALHEAGVAHRDITPANVLLHEGGAKLSDLGLAEVLAPGRAVGGMGSISSLEYVDPALITGADASRASDIFSLGMTLHRALTGTSMYGAIPEGDPLAAVRHVLATPPVPAPGLEPALAAVVTACIADDPLERPETADDLAVRLDRLNEEVWS